jgi:hypothetical protein
MSIVDAFDHDNMLQAEFHAVARALANEIKRAVATQETEPNNDLENDDTDEERYVNSVRSGEMRPEIGRLISHLHNIGVELRARNLIPLGLKP